MSIWQIVTGEYPPQPGGVSDYTWMVANGLASAGETVHVWAPQCALPGAAVSAVEVHRLPGSFGPHAMVSVVQAVHANPECSVLVQYVPHAYGFKAMNLPFCWWLYSIRQANLTIMFHEVAFPISRTQPLRHNVLGAVTQLMARLACRSAKRIMVASAKWQPLLRRLGATAPILWVPIPSNVPVVANELATATWRGRYCVAGGLLMGHFANYSNYSVERLSQVLPALLHQHQELSMLLLGANSEKLRQRLLHTNRQLACRLIATGPLAPDDLSAALAACDLMVQPYPDGVSTRRSSTSALLAHGRPIVTTKGIGTEDFWNNGGAAALAPAENPGRLQEELVTMLSSDELRRDYSHKALALYEQRFALRHTIEELIASLSGVFLSSPPPAGRDHGRSPRPSPRAVRCGGSKKSEGAALGGAMKPAAEAMHSSSYVREKRGSAVAAVRPRG